MVEERESFESQWAPSDVTEDNLKEMVAHGVLPAKEIIGWRPAFGEAFPTPDTHEIVDTWNSLPMGDEAAQAVELMERMIKLKEQGLQGEQITQHFIKCRLAPIKERSRTAFEFDGKHDPNREDPDSLDFKVMKERMYKIFSNAIVVSYSHLLPVVPFNAFNPPPPEFALMKSDPPIAQRRSPRHQTGQGSGGPRIRSETQPSASDSVGQSDSRKRKLVLSDDEADDTTRRPGDRETTKKLSKQATPKKKTSSRPAPKIRKSSRKPSDIDPSGKDSDPTSVDANSSKEIGTTAEDRPSDNQPATDNVESGDQPPIGNQSAEAEAGVNQEPPTRNQSDARPSQEIPEVGAQADSLRSQDASNNQRSRSPLKASESTHPHPEIIMVDTLGPMISDEEEIPRIQAAEDSRPPILVKWWDDNMQPQGTVINKQKEDEELCLLKKALGQATHIVNRIHLRNEAKTETLERLVPHLGTLEATRSLLHETKELARKNEHDLRNRIAELQESNFELSGSSKVNVVQTAKISQLEKQIQILENDKAELARQRDLALKEVEDRKIKSQAQFDVLVSKIKKLEGARDEVDNAAAPIVQAMFLNNNGPSALDASEIFDKLRVAPDIYFKNIKEAGSMGVSMALAMTKSLYPRVDIDVIDGFADGTSEEAALDLISDAQKAADKIAADVVERFQDTDLRPTGPGNSDDEKTETD
uniref:Gypsy-type retrotransposon RIRE2 protein n=2 Tax=Oryza sativa subsp. japonica TaxID=39947 RepID=A0A5S6R8W8_ORYSJ|nr:putative gypsy-type retrotransposon RIRE2 protein [Oryza sativa Japonica Group]AAP54204.1 retrotransposon protein, putative, unclassified [Oryza sativa Japonica Group]